MSYLFDTDAISETLRKKPLPDYIQWLHHVSREDQYTSTIVIGELYKGAYRSSKQREILTKIREKILPELTILPFDISTAEIYGQIYAELEQKGQIIAHTDLQIAATAIQHNLELVTGNIRHFARVPNLVINYIVSDARKKRQ